MSAKIRLLVLLTACAYCSSRSFCQQEGVRNITVHVEVRDHEGNPISGVALSTFVEPWRSVGASARPSSDGDGRLALTLSVPVSAGLLKLVPAPAYSATQTPSQALQLNQQFQVLKRNHAFQSTYRVPLDPQMEQYSLSIVTWPAMTISGRLVDADGVPLHSGTAIARGCACFAASKRDGSGTFELTGLPRGEAAQLFIGTDGKFGRILHLTAEQTQADFDLGDIALHPIAGVSRARVLAAPENMRREGTSRLWTLVSDDANTIVPIIVDASDGRPRTPWLEPGQGWLPPGRYYVLPNSIGFGGDDTGWLLLDLIRAGKAVDHPELVSFVAAPNEETAVTVDPEDVRAKIKAAAQAEGPASE